MGSSISRHVDLELPGPGDLRLGRRSRRKARQLQPGTEISWLHAAGLIEEVSEFSAHAVRLQAQQFGAEGYASLMLQIVQSFSNEASRGVFHLSVKRSIFNSGQKSLKEAKCSLMLMTQETQSTLPNRSVQDYKVGGL